MSLRRNATVFIFLPSPPFWEGSFGEGEGEEEGQREQLWRGEYLHKAWWSRRGTEDGDYTRQPTHPCSTLSAPPARCSGQLQAGSASRGVIFPVAVWGGVCTAGRGGKEIRIWGAGETQTRQEGRLDLPWQKKSWFTQSSWFLSRWHPSGLFWRLSSDNTRGSDECLARLNLSILPSLPSICCGNQSSPIARFFGIRCLANTGAAICQAGFRTEGVEIPGPRGSGVCPPPHLCFLLVLCKRGWMSAITAEPRT